MMKEEFNYQSVPYNFAHCFNNQCPKAGKCLRNIAAQHCTNNYPTLRIINPACIPANADTCPHFQTNAKIHVAWGIKDLLDNVPHKYVSLLKSQMLAYFGRGKYYRFYRKECYLTPEDQAYIGQLFRRNGYEGELAFDSYSDEYDWK